MFLGLGLSVSRPQPASAAAPPAATVVGIYLALGDIAGGTAVVIEVDDSTGATGATVGGVALTGFMISDATHVSGSTGAHAAGLTDVIVTNGGGPSAPLVNAFEYWSPAQETLSLLLQPGDYTSPTWTGSASAGTSAGKNLTEATNPPATGAGNIPDYEANDLLAFGGLSNTFVADAAGTIVVIFRADTAAVSAGAGSRVDDEGIVFQDGGGVTWGISYSTSGVCALIYDGVSYKEVPPVAAATAAWHMVVMKWNGANLYMGVDGAALTSVASGNCTANAGDLVTGRNYAASFYDGKQRFVAAALTALPDATLAKFYTWAQGKGYFA